MLVPETATDINYFLASGENQVWLAGEFWRMKPVTVAHAVDETAHA
jgi:hypothetical protein